MKHDITIAGGGLAGLSLAIGLRRHGVSVHLHEAGEYPRHRVCGEFISGIEPSSLKAIGIEDCLEDAQRHEAFSWFEGDKELRRGRLKQAALAISRHRLDDRLQQKARELGAEISTSSRLPDQPDTPGYVRAAGRVPTRGDWVGLKAHFKGLELSSGLEMHTGPQGYLGITPVEDGWFNVCGLFRVNRSLQSRHEELLLEYLELNSNQRLAGELREAEWRPDSFSAVAGFKLGAQAPTPGLLCLGDSHSIIPPFTGNGMSMAFQSVETALPHLVAYASGTISWEDSVRLTERALAKRFRKRLTASRLLHPLLFRRASRRLLKLAPLTPVLSLIR